MTAPLEAGLVRIPENIARLARVTTALHEAWRKEELWDIERHLQAAGEQLLLAGIEAGWCLHDKTPQSLKFEDGKELDESEEWSCEDCRDLWTEDRPA